MYISRELERKFLSMNQVQSSSGNRCKASGKVDDVKASGEGI